MKQNENANWRSPKIWKASQNFISGIFSLSSWVRANFLIDILEGSSIFPSSFIEMPIDDGYSTRKSIVITPKMKMIVPSAMKVYPQWSV